MAQLCMRSVATGPEPSPPDQRVRAGERSVPSRREAVRPLTAVPRRDWRLTQSVPVTPRRVLNGCCLRDSLGERGCLAPCCCLLRGHRHSTVLVVGASLTTNTVDVCSSPVTIMLQSCYETTLRERPTGSRWARGRCRPTDASRWDPPCAGAGCRTSRQPTPDRQVRVRPRACLPLSPWWARTPSTCC